MKLLLTTIALLRILSTEAQKKDPVQWYTNLTKVGDTAYTLVFTAEVEGGWHIYSQDISNGISEQTAIKFKPNPMVKVSTVVEYSGAKCACTELKGTITYTVQVKPKFKQVNTSLNVSVTYQACTDIMCNPPKTLTYTIPIK